MFSIFSRPFLSRLADGPAYRQAPMRLAYATVTIVVIIGLYVLLWLWQVKSLGVTINWTGELLSVQPGTMAERVGLRPGDYVTFEEFQRLKRFSAQAEVGQTVEVAVHHDGEWRPVTLQAMPHSPQRLLSLSVEPFAGILFSLLGLAPLVARRRGLSLWLFFIGLQLTALFFVTDIPRAHHQLWGEIIAYVTFPLFPAVAFHFHTVFPQERLGRMHRRVVILVYLAAAAILPFNLVSIWDYAFHVSDPWQWVISLYQATLLAACAGLVIRTYATTRDPRVRAQLKIITACLSVGLSVPAIVVVLILMFDLDTSELLKSGTIFVGLVVPAGYAYSMARHNLLIGGLLWRPGLIRVVYTSALSLGLVAFAVSVFPGSVVLAGNSALIAWAAIVLLAVALAGVHEWLGRWTETHLFKGSNYIALLASATGELARFHHLAEYVRFFTERFPARLKSTGSLVFLVEEAQDHLTLQGRSPSLPLPLADEEVPSIPPDSELRGIMQSAGGPVALSMLLMPHSFPFSGPDLRLLQLLRAAGVEWLLPLVSSQPPRLIGLVALGAKETDEAYSGQEVTALTALARTASISAENVLMLEALQKRVIELDQEREYSAALARDVSAAQDRERARISGEIHDTVLQELVVALRLLTRLRDRLQQALGGLEDSVIVLERLGGSAHPHGPTSLDHPNTPSAREELERMLGECQAVLAALLGEGAVEPQAPATTAGGPDCAQVPGVRSASLGELPDRVNGKHLVEDILCLVRATSQRLREICTDLHPAYLDASLVRTLSRSVDRFRQLSPDVVIEFGVSGSEPPGLSANAKAVCKKVMEQAVHNALNHASPARIQVALTFTPPNSDPGKAAQAAQAAEANRASGDKLSGAAASLTLSVVDDGAGFEPRTPRYWRSAERHGLANMYESAALIGATLELDSTPGRGTRVSLHICEA